MSILNDYAEINLVDLF